MTDTTRPGGMQMDSTPELLFAGEIPETQTLKTRRTPAPVPPLLKPVLQPILKPIFSAVLLVLLLILSSCAGGPDSRKELKDETLRLEDELTSVRDERDELREQILKQEQILAQIQEITGDTTPDTLPRSIAELESAARSNEEELEKLRRQFARSREEVERLSKALEEADFASSLFSRPGNTPTTDPPGADMVTAPAAPDAETEPGSGNGTDSSGDATGDFSRASRQPGEDAGEKILENGTVFDAASIGRSPGRVLEGSKIIRQQDEAGISYLSLENQRHSTDIPAYLEIQQRPGVGLGLYLVLQQITGSSERAFGLYGGDIELAGSFLYTLPEPEYREQLRDPAYRLERIYIPVGRRLLQALERISTEEKGRIILKGLYTEEEYLINRTRARGLEEMLSTFLELGNYQ